MRGRVMKHLDIYNFCFCRCLCEQVVVHFYLINAGREYLSTRVVGTQLGLGHVIFNHVVFEYFLGVFCTKTCGKLLGTQELTH